MKKMCDMCGSILLFDEWEDGSRRTCVWCEKRLEDARDIVQEILKSREEEKGGT